MNLMDLVYIAVTLAFFVACDLTLSVVDERKSERRR